MRGCAASYSQHDCSLALAGGVQQIGRMLGSIILTGGPSRRMGADKAEVDWAGYRAIDRVHSLARACGAERIVTVGARGYGFAFVADAGPHPGPVAGVITGAQTLKAGGVDRLLVLAVDAPTIALSDLAPLLARAEGAAYEGLHIPFAAPLDRLSPEAEPDWPLARLVERSGLARLPAPPAALARLRGANTPQEHQALLAELEI
jgi:molybdopterin-guanine dinucleotide biosynthesis protein A